MGIENLFTVVNLAKLLHKAFRNFQKWSRNRESLSENEIVLFVAYLIA